MHIDVEIVPLYIFISGWCLGTDFVEDRLCGAASAGRWAAVVRVERWPGPPSSAQQPVIAPPRPRQAGDTGTRPAPSVYSQYTSRSHPAKMPSEPRTLHPAPCTPPSCGVTSL